MAIINRRKRLLLIKRNLLLIQLYYQLVGSKKRTYGRRRWWIHPIWRNRKTEGYYATLLKCMRSNDHKKFRNFTRMNPNLFDKLLKMVEDKLQKYPHNRSPIPPGERLALTLRFLASGASLVNMTYAFRLGKTTAHRIIKETCAAIWETLLPLYLPVPDEKMWARIAKEYETLWDYPMCCGAVDGKHVMIQQPGKSGTLYYNYKGYNSIVLMAVVDAKYRFVVVDIGGYGSHSDGGVFKSSSFGQAVQNQKAGFPQPRAAPNSDIVVPHVLLGDEAFQLLPNFMRPYPGNELDSEKRIFNYRLSRARRCSENAFGILAARWRIFRGPMLLKPSNVDIVVKACVILHNYLLIEEAKEKSKIYCPDGFADSHDLLKNVEHGKWREVLECLPAKGLTSFKPSKARNFSLEASDVRKAFTRYFSSENGEVPWQWGLPGVQR